MATVQRLEDENAQYLSMLASGNVSLDGVSLEGIRPLVLPVCSADRLRRDIAGFKAAQVEGYEKLDDSVPETAQGKALTSVISRFKR
jgi:hypothetical protein